MFELKNTDVKLQNLTTRTEKHGDEEVPAVSIKLNVTLQNTVLDQFDPALLKSFYTKFDSDQAELIKNDFFPDLRFAKLKPLIWDEEFTGYRLKICDELEGGDAAKFIISDCTLKKFMFEMKQGGSVELTFTLNCDPSGDVVGYLYEQQKYNLKITLEPSDESFSSGDDDEDMAA